MRYNTCFSITVLDNNLNPVSDTISNIIILKIVTISGYEREQFQYHEPIKWYDHENDLCEISSGSKDLIIKVEGFGDETGDIWIKYFHNGKLQVCNAITTFAPYDPYELRKPDEL